MLTENIRRLKTNLRAITQHEDLFIIFPLQSAHKCRCNFWWAV